MSVSVTLAEVSDGVHNGSRQCQVAGLLDFTTANQALDSVSALIKEHKSLTIDLSGVDSSNSAGLALLIEWRAIARASDHSVTFSHIPDSLRQLAQVCQVDGLI